MAARAFILLTIGLSLASGCAARREGSAVVVTGPPPAELQELVTGGLALSGDRVEFDGDLSIPPVLRGVPATSTIKLQITPGSRPPVEETRQRMRALAVGHTRAKAALGNRFALLSSGWLEVDKSREPSAADDRYQMVFYNYTGNRIVTVVASAAGEIVDVRAQRPEVQPPESAEEIEAAAGVVRADERYGPATRNLRVRGIQTEGRDDHRTLYLTFYEADRRQAVYEATVDMTAGRVLSARALR